MIYYSNQYLKAQSYRNLLRFESEQFLILMNVLEITAHSIPSSPFGGVLAKKTYSKLELAQFITDLKIKLHTEGISKLHIFQSPSYYKELVKTEHLLTLGFCQYGLEINQYINLDSFYIHQMERRVLKKTHDIQVEICQDLNIVHGFISRCRKQQGLEINISFDKIATLSSVLPETFSTYIAKHKNQLISALITVQATPKILYYYLPATDQNYKHLSPMVHLMKRMYEDAKANGISIIDLGKSSIDGVKQKGLFQFKKNMGAQAVEITNLTLDI